MSSPDDAAVDPTPVYIGVSACRHFDPDSSRIIEGVKLHSRRKPCGIILQGSPIPSFKCIVEDAFEDHNVSVRACQYCGGDI